MKHTVTIRAFSAFLSALLALSALTVHALASRPAELKPRTETDIEKLTAFFNQPTATEGILNGDACYIVDIPEDAGTMFGGSYNGGASTPLVEYGKFMLSFGIWVYGEFYDPNTGQTLAWDDWDYPVCPDLYGPLDLAGTSFILFENRHRNSTHITQIILDGCQRLKTADIGYQSFCTELSALDCPQLEKIEGNETAFGRIAVQPAAFSEPLYASVFGNGTICELNYNKAGGEALTLCASESESFVGWFDGGVLVSENREFSVTNGANLVACFGGDANVDGSIGISDAVLALRAAMSENAPQNAAMLDINGDGSVSVADAIMIARFALGIH